MISITFEISNDDGSKSRVPVSTSMKVREAVFSISREKCWNVIAVYNNSGTVSAKVVNGEILDDIDYDLILKEAIKNASISLVYKPSGKPSKNSTKIDDESKKDGHKKAMYWQLQDEMKAKKGVVGSHSQIEAKETGRSAHGDSDVKGITESDGIFTKKVECSEEVDAKQAISDLRSMFAHSSPGR